jgi:hypothetical protein
MLDDLGREAEATMTAPGIFAGMLKRRRQQLVYGGGVDPHPRQAALSLARGRPGWKCTRHSGPEPAQRYRSHTILPQAAEGLAIGSAGDWILVVWDLRHRQSRNCHSCIVRSRHRARSERVRNHRREWAIPDLDLIKQVEQGRGTGAGGLPRAAPAIPAGQPWVKPGHGG